MRMECPLLLGDRVIGAVRWRREGGRLALDAVCPMEPGYIYRVELTFPQTRRLLGVMLPENGRFRLRKSLAAADEPLSARVLRALPGEDRAPPLPFAFSRLAPRETADLVRDPLFLAAAPARVPAAEENGRRWLALPFRLGAETALAPFLCVCAVLERGDACYAVFCADGHGALRPPSDGAV